MSGKKLIDGFPRRDFLKGVGGAAALSVGACTTGRNISNYYGQPELIQPKVEKSQNGFLSTVVNAQMGQFNLGNQNVNLRCYNGNPVGHTLDVHAGDVLRLRLNNNLPFEEFAGVCLEPTNPVDNTPRGFNTTNMHTHGLHVSPKPPSDDILLEVSSGGGRFDYVYEIPSFHPPGTYYYHAHLHGSTAIQVSSGMGGCLIVRGDVDEIPAIKAAEEKVLVIQTQRFDENGECNDFGILNKGDMTYINGQVNPVIRMKAGEVQRWRMVNASHMVPFSIKLQRYQYTTTMPFTVLCVDGNPVPQTYENNTLEMVPGNRFDVLVKGFDPGIYHLTGGETAGTIATLIVEGEGDDMELYSGKLPQSPLLKPISASEVQFGRRFEFDFVYGEKPKFTINNNPFSCDDPIMVELGCVEEWEVYNHTAYPHPFHIHVNPFQVIEGGGVKPGTWMDTINFPPFERIRFRTRFENFTGTFVFHCHNLMHEDMGMMQAVTVFDKNKA